MSARIVGSRLRFAVACLTGLGSVTGSAFGGQAGRDARNDEVRGVVSESESEQGREKAPLVALVAFESPSPQTQMPQLGTTNEHE